MMSSDFITCKLFSPPTLHTAIKQKCVQLVSTAWFLFQFCNTTVRTECHLHKIKGYSLLFLALVSLFWCTARLALVIFSSELWRSSHNGLEPFQLNAAVDSQRSADDSIKDFAEDATQTTEKTMAIAEKGNRARENSTHHSITNLKTFKKYLKGLNGVCKTLVIWKTVHSSSFCPQRIMPKSHNCVKQWWLYAFDHKATYLLLLILFSQVPIHQRVKSLSVSTRV